MAPNKQSGTVLITVVMMVALAALIVTDISYRQKMDINRTAALLSRDQAFQYLLGAEAIANLTLVEDLKEDRKVVQGGAPVLKDTLAENWAKESNPFPVAGGMIKGKLVDLQSRFNINSIVSTDAQTANKQKAILRTIFINEKIPGDPESTVTAQILIDRMLDWMDGDQEPTGFDGKEDLDYLTQDPPYRAGNQIMYDLSELVLIEGFTPEDVSKLADVVCFLPPDTPINLNTAEPKLLDAIFQTENVALTSVQFIKERELKNKIDGKPGFSNEQDIMDVLTRAGVGNSSQATQVETEQPDEEGSITEVTGGNDTRAPTANNLQGNYSVFSEYYLLEAEAVINAKPVLMRSVLYRPTLKLEDGQKKEEIVIKTIFRKLEDPLKRV
ncbi:type II secretion system minor pseudopilin GspK [Ketobacter nezhaii]|uniref:type II secretion system minor pseudopilin GspK n=1 Tax=Ketobacter sp. MCCC 1A13808 TaxID=2602738 RepID=UPI0018DD069E|nr:type II secretion system minor pseudopilin GspK [Ketobacter sp. MCCC 1A13808]